MATLLDITCQEAIEAVMHILVDECHYSQDEAENITIKDEWTQNDREDWVSDDGEWAWIVDIYGNIEYRDQLYPRYLYEYEVYEPWKEQQAEDE